MNCVCIYWSRYGNNKKIMDILSKKLKDKGKETKIFKTDDLDPKSIPEADFYVFSAPAEAFRIQKDMRNFMKGLNLMDGKKYGIINTHGMKRNWLSSMEKTLSKKNMIKAAEIDFRIDGDPKTGEALPEGWEEKLDDFAMKFK